MKTLKTSRKLSLSRETLVRLAGSDLTAVAGGYAYTHTCPPTVSYCALSHCVVCSP